MKKLNMVFVLSMFLVLVLAACAGPAATDGGSSSGGGDTAAPAQPAAPAGDSQLPVDVPREEQMDLVRRMPMETGVIDLPGFMIKLQALGYDGPVTPEPFSERVNAIEDPLEAAQFTAGYMDQMWQAAGLS